MDWSKGYSSHWRIYRVDPDTWADAGLVGGVTRVAIERDGTGSEPLLESGSIYVDSSVGEDFRECYIRVALYAEQDGGAERVDVATLLCSSVSGDIDRGADERELEGRSVLYTASTKIVEDGTYAPKGADGAAWAASMLRDSIKAPVEVDGSFTLESNIVFDIGSTYLKCVWQILDAGRFVIQIQGDGAVHILGIPTEPDLMLDNAGARLLHPGIEYDFDLSGIPNRYIAVEGIHTAVAVNDDPSSIVSVSSRGYVSDKRDGSPARVNGESLAQYAARKLEEASTVPDVRTYTREYFPGVYPFSMVRGTLSSVNMSGDLRVATQSLSCDKGITVQEKAQREVSLWQR